MGNARLQADSTYRNGIPIPATYFQGLDTAQSQGVDGDAGGTWSPTAPMIVGGAGFMLTSPNNSMSGGATIVTPSGSGKRVRLAANDVPLLQFGHTLGQRIIETSIAGTARTAGPIRWNSFAHVGYQAFQYGAPITAPAPLPGRAVGKRMVVRLRVQHGSTLQQARLDYQVAVPRTVLPDHLPAMRIYAVDVNGVFTPLAVPPAPFIAPGGWYLTDPGSLTPAGYSTGTNSILYVPNTAGPAVFVDCTRYAYFAEILDESSSIAGLGSGTGNSQPGNIFLRVTATFTNIQSLAFQ